MSNFITVDYNYNEEHCEDTNGCNKFEKKSNERHI